MRVALLNVKAASVQILFSSKIETRQASSFSDRGQKRCRANMARIRQSRPDSCLGVSIETIQMFLSCPLFARRC